MAVSLVKGGNLSLDKEEPGLREIVIGLGWDARSTDGQPFDLDASCFLLKADGRVRTDQDFIFYNQTETPDGSVRHSGDNRTGEGEGDDESIFVRLDAVAPEIQKISITVTIYDAHARGQNFGQVSNAYVRIVNKETDKEIVRYDLTEDYSLSTAMIFAELYRRNGEWKFKAIGEGYRDGLKPLAEGFGVNV